MSGRVTQMRVYAYSTPQRPKPKAGDRRTTKKHGTQIRVHERHNGMVVMTGGHRNYRWEWKSPVELIGTIDEYLLTLEDRIPFAKSVPCGRPVAHILDTPRGFMCSSRRDSRNRYHGSTEIAAYQHWRAKAKAGRNAPLFHLATIARAKEES